MEAKVYNQQGKETGTITLPEQIFGLRWNSDLVHQVVVSMTSSARDNIAHTKTRGEVRGGGKKPWQQKGTGRARHGSTRSPLWVGGGVSHGPRNDKNYDRKVNKKMKAKALYTILSRKLRDNEVFFVDEFKLSGKTKDAVAALGTLGKSAGFPVLSDKRNNALYMALGVRDTAVIRGFRNVGNVAVEESRTMNPTSLLQYKTLLIVNPNEALEALGAKMDMPSATPKEKVSRPKKKVAAKAKKAAVKKIPKAKQK